MMSIIGYLYCKEMKDPANSELIDPSIEAIDAITDIQLEHELAFRLISQALYSKIYLIIVKRNKKG